MSQLQLDEDITNRIEGENRGFQLIRQKALAQLKSVAIGYKQQEGMHLTRFLVIIQIKVEHLKARDKDV